jgi:hypothetical protein
MMFVTLEQAKAQIEIDHDDSDDLIVGYILSASAAVKNYLKSGSVFELERDADFNPVLDSNGDPVYQEDSSGGKIISYVVQAATLILVAYHFKDRDNNASGEFEQGYLPKPVTALLYPLRDPAIA